MYVCKIKMFGVYSVNVCSYLFILEWIVLILYCLQFQMDSLILEAFLIIPPLMFEGVAQNASK